MRNNPLQIGLLLILMLAGCRGEGDGNGAASSSDGGGDVQTATLTGLYESGDSGRRNQLCMIEREGGRTSFGFVAWGSGERSCSGSGPVTREGDRLLLKLDGDESCSLAARVEGRRVTFPAEIAAQCHDYYCGAGAQMRGITFDKVAGTEADAMRAADLVGDPLCAG